MNISYTKQGDYLLPNLILKEKVQYNIGKYGLLKLEYIKKEKLGLYFDLLVNNTLNEYLHDIDEKTSKDYKKNLRIFENINKLFLDIQKDVNTLFDEKYENEIQEQE